MRRASVVIIVTTLASSAIADPGHPEAAIRAGFQYTEIMDDDDAPAGRGPLFELEVGWRFAEWISVAAFGAYSSIDDSIQDPFPPPPTHQAHVRFIDVGARVNAHFHGAFAGVGLGFEHYSQTDDTGSFGLTYPLGELHLGFTFPAFHRVAPQIVGMLTHTVGDDGAEIDSLRIAVGVQF